jgi:hypothetical protein
MSHARAIAARDLNRVTPLRAERACSTALVKNSKCRNIELRRMYQYHPAAIHLETCPCRIAD